MAETMDALSKRCDSLRADFLGIGTEILALKDGYHRFIEDFPGQHAEMKSNVMLAYRHLEDARMRIGKVLQQIQGGKSMYDLPTEVES